MTPPETKCWRAPEVPVPLKVDNESHIRLKVSNLQRFGTGLIQMNTVWVDTCLFPAAFRSKSDVFISAK